MKEPTGNEQQEWVNYAVSLDLDKSAASMLKVDQLKEWCRTRKLEKDQAKRGVSLRASAGLAAAVIIAGAVFLAWRTDRPAQFLGGGVALLGILGFMAFYLGRGDEDSMRSAITGSVVLVFVVAASLTLFSPTLQGVTTGNASYEDKDATIARESTEVLNNALEADAASSSSPGDGSNGNDSNDEATTNEQSAAAEIASTSETVPKDLLGLFRWVVVAVVGFYFASTTLEKFRKPAASD